MRKSTLKYGLLLLFSMGGILFLWKSSPQRILVGEKQSVTHSGEQKGTPLGSPKQRPVSGRAKRDSGSYVWRDIDVVLDGLKVLERHDQQGLDILFDRAKKIIRRHPDQAYAYFQAQLKEFIHPPLDRSFFLIHCFMVLGPRPQDAINAIMDYEITYVDPNWLTGDSHHNFPSPPERLERVKAFAFRHFKEAVEKGQISKTQLDTKKTAYLLKVATELAETSSNLDLAIEATHLVAVLSPDPKRAVQAILSSRTEEERGFMDPF